MIALRKFLAAVYFIAFIVLVGGMACLWYGIEPVASAVLSQRGQYWFEITYLVLIGISLIGALVLLLRALSVRSKNTFQSSQNELGYIQVSRGAIAREVEVVMEKHPELKCLQTKVVIKNGRTPTARIKVRVSPIGSLPMAELSARLQQEIKEAVEVLTGNAVRSVTIDVRKSIDPEDNNDIVAPFGIGSFADENSAEAPAEQPQAAKKEGKFAWRKNKAAQEEQQPSAQESGRQEPGPVEDELPIAQPAAAQEALEQSGEMLPVPPSEEPVEVEASPEQDSQE